MGTSTATLRRQLLGASSCGQATSKALHQVCSTFGCQSVVVTGSVSQFVTASCHISSGRRGANGCSHPWNGVGNRRVVHPEPSSSGSSFRHALDVNNSSASPGTASAGIRPDSHGAVAAGGAKLESGQFAVSNTNKKRWRESQEVSEEDRNLCKRGRGSGRSFSTDLQARIANQPNGELGNQCFGGNGNETFLLLSGDQGRLGNNSSEHFRMIMQIREMLQELGGLCFSGLGLHLSSGQSSIFLQGGQDQETLWSSRVVAQAYSMTWAGAVFKRLSPLPAWLEHRVA